MRLSTRGTSSKYKGDACDQKRFRLIPVRYFTSGNVVIASVRVRFTALGI